ncbi:hypothetical protein GCM10010170_004460 [Dactylosporangium salmoneum]|uniref:Uncharacterized protein n=1 Tax=Dactylosporangium salmoneum TaxID=53361 RepID=A0ABN3FES7_9ACTN
MRCSGRSHLFGPSALLGLVVLFGPSALSGAFGPSGPFALLGPSAVWAGRATQGRPGPRSVDQRVDSGGPGAEREPEPAQRPASALGGKMPAEVDPGLGGAGGRW